MLSYIFYLFLYPTLLIASIFFGRKVANRSIRKKHQWKAVGVESGLIGFYALVTSFTLAQSANNTGNRDAMIHNIADDMSEVLRVVKTSSPEIESRVRLYFSEFYGIIKTPFEPTTAGITSRINTIDRLDVILDNDMKKILAKNPEDRGQISTLLGKTDRLESLYYRFMHSYEKNVSALILFILVLFSLFIGFLIGFIEKYHNNHIHIISIMFVVISFIVLNLIHDLDNPTIGFLQPDIEDIAEVVQTFQLIK